ncbi:MAG: hypothetical protein ABWW66_03930 [Archaeoglobaceae archaeon]
MGYFLPVSVERGFEAGVVEVTVNETVVEGEKLKGVVLFNGSPANVTVKIGSSEFEANGFFEVEVPLKLGRNELLVEVPELLYSQRVVVYQKRPVNIEARFENEKLVVSVFDVYGNPADGFVEVGGVVKILENGVAVFEGGADRIVYLGSEKYLPAVKELGGFPLHLLLLPIAAILVYYARKLAIGRIEFFVEKEHPELPDVWDVGEEVRIRLSEPALVEINGKTVFGDEVSFRTERYGVVRLRAYAGGSWRRKEGEMTITVAPYSEAIAEIIRRLDELAKSRLENVESLTAREVMQKLGVRAEVLLNYFERAKYRGERYGRKEFVEAFMDFLRVMKDENR